MSVELELFLNFMYADRFITKLSSRLPEGFVQSSISDIIDKILQDNDNDSEQWKTLDQTEINKTGNY